MFARSFPAFGRASCTPSARRSPGWSIDEGASFPEHQHPHEQAVNVLEGTLELVVGGADASADAGADVRDSA